MNILLRVYVVGATITCISNGVYIGYKEFNKLTKCSNIIDQSTDIALEIIATGSLRGAFWPIYVPVLYLTHKKVNEKC